MLSAATPNGQGAIGVSASEIAAMLSVLQAGFASVGGVNATLTAAQLATGQVLTSGGATPTLTTDTAANIIAQLTQSSGATPRIGQTFMLDIANLNSGTATLAGGTGVTISGTATIAANAERYFLGIITQTAQIGGTPSVTIQNMWSNTGVAA